MACHNYLSRHPIPPGTRDLLGLGLNYTIIPKQLSTTTDTFDRLRQDVRRKYHLLDAEPNTDQYGPDYIPGLYIKSDYKFKPAPEDIEQAIDAFETAITSAQKRISTRQRPKPNLSLPQQSLLQFLRRHDKYIVIESDKGLGPAILDRTFYFERGCSEHLGNRRNYKIITKLQANTKMRFLHMQFDSWMRIYYWDQYYARKNGEPFDEEGPVGITDAEGTFLLRAVQRNPDKLAKFRMTLKVHKIPFKFRPIVSCCGTFMNDWSRWLDYQLQKCKPFIPTYIRDGQQVLDELALLVLTPRHRIFVADANSMYNNIDTDHAIMVISAWLDEIGALIDDDFFPVEAIKAAMTIIMRNNIFEWGTLTFLQLIGTAMGTSAACMWATMYYGYHETKVLLPKYGSHLLYFKRFIDDIIGIWLVEDDSTTWTNFKADVNDFGILTWEIEEPGMSVNFLDMTLTINGSKIDSRTYQKPMNLYLYLPPMSAHSPSVIKGTIYGLLSRYFAQNTYRKDYIHFVVLLYRRLLDRGWTREQIYPIFVDAATRIESKPTSNTPPSKKDASSDDALFIHLQYHPYDIARQDIRRLYDEHLSKTLENSIRVTCPTIAYSRLRNISEYVTQAKLHEPPGYTSESKMGEYQDGLDPS